MILQRGQAGKRPEDRTASPGTAAPPLTPQDLAPVRAELTRAVARVCPRWLSGRAEDLVQIALLRLIEVSRKREGNVEFSSFYLRKAAYSAVVDEIRRLRRRQEVSLEEGPAAGDRPAEDPDPERRSAAREIGRGIHDCLSGLIRPRRLAVTLHLQGHPVAETARLLGWPVKKAENLVYRGMADLRGCLEAKGMGRR
jgi:RNA polymerase sigma-70 factor, ECF subfamily